VISPPRPQSVAAPLPPLLAAAATLALALAITSGLTPGALAAAPLPPPAHLASFALADQFGQTNRVEFPRDRPLLLLVGDRRGSEEVDAWIAPLKQRWSTIADLAGIADVSAAPRFLRGRIQEGIRKQRPRPLLLDFDGKVTTPLRLSPRTANLLVVDRDGRVLARLTGKPDDAKLEAVRAALETPRTPPVIP
jgi:hypothetical protein